MAFKIADSDTIEKMLSEVAYKSHIKHEISRWPSNTSDEEYAIREMWNALIYQNGIIAKNIGDRAFQKTLDGFLRKALCQESADGNLPVTLAFYCGDYGVVCEIPDPSGRYKGFDEFVGTYKQLEEFPDIVRENLYNLLVDCDPYENIRLKDLKDAYYALLGVLGKFASDADSPPYIERLKGLLEALEIFFTRRVHTVDEVSENKERINEAYALLRDTIQHSELFGAFTGIWEKFRPFKHSHDTATYSEGNLYVHVLDRDKHDYWGVRVVMTRDIL